MIRYSCHSENFGRLSGPDTFAFIKALGFDCIDVASRSLIPQEQILENPDSAAEYIRQLSVQYELPLSELFLSDVYVDGKNISPVFAPLYQKDFQRNFQKICSFAKKAGFLSIMGSAGNCDDKLGFSKSFQLAAQTLHLQTQIAISYDLAFHVEPSRLSLLNTVEAAQAMISQVPALKYSLDFLHYHVNNVPLKESLTLIPLAGHMHARQAKIPDGKCDFSEGTIDYSSIVKELKHQNWSGDIAMEFWCSDEMKKQGIQSVEQNILMRYQLKKLFQSVSS